MMAALERMGDNLDHLAHANTRVATHAGRAADRLVHCEDISHFLRVISDTILRGATAVENMHTRMVALGPDDNILVQEARHRIIQSDTPASTDGEAAPSRRRRRNRNNLPEMNIDDI